MRLIRKKWQAVVDILKGLRYTDERVMNLLMGKRENSKKLYLHTNATDIEFNGETGHGFMQLLKDVNYGNWNIKLDQLREYISITGIYPSSKSKDFTKRALGMWVVRQRRIYNGTIHDYKLMEEQIFKLQQLPNWVWKIDSNEKWNTIFTQLSEYLKQYNKYPSRCADKYGITLYAWMKRQKRAYNSGTLINDRISKLQQLPNWVWKVDFNENWNATYEQLSEYLKHHEKYPYQRSDEKGIKFLSRWIQHQKNAYNGVENNKLTDDRISKLQQLPNWTWKIDLNEKWNTMYERLQQYLEQHKKYPSHHSEDIDAKHIGIWIVRQKAIYTGVQEGILTNDQISKLQQLPNWIWKVDYGEKWNTYFEQLRQYLEQHKKFPSSYSKNKDIKTLGLWVGRQKSIYNGTSGDGTLTDEQISKLNSLPLDWHPNRAKAAAKLLKSLDTSILKTQPLILPTSNSAVKPKSYLRASRPNQATIRKLALQKYKKCVLSNVAIPQCLDAMHIVSYAYLKKHNILDEFIDHIDNVIIMSKELHPLFDSYQFTFDTFGKLLYDTNNIILQNYFNTRCVNQSIENFTDNYYFQRHRAFYCQIHGITPVIDLHEIEVENLDE